MAYNSNATITGRGMFPMDMLRYDGCYPYSSEDVDKIVQTISGSVGPWSIKVSRRVDKVSQMKSCWTVGRWESFGVKITI